jgi:hypothetical protein
MALTAHVGGRPGRRAGGELFFKKSAADSWSVFERFEGPAPVKNGVL